MLYKAFLVILILGLVAIRRYYQRGYHREEVVKAPRALESWMATIVSAALLLPISIYLFSDWFSGLYIPLPPWVRWLGFGVGVSGLVLMWWCHDILGENWQPDIAIRREHRLITHGPYRLIRHPMYLSFILLGLGMALTAANWAMAFFTCLPPMIAHLRRSKQEEELLEETFGEDYLAYKDRTGSLFPKIK
jgi:protein-S-isoprenylcysteine O-methyltransferase Ste14